MSVVESVLQTFHEKSKLLTLGKSKIQIKEAETFFETLKKKSPLAFDVCFANLFVSADKSEQLLSSQLLCWYCKHNNLTPIQFDQLLNVTGTYIKQNQKVIFTQLLLACSAAICRQYISSAIMGKSNPISSILSNISNSFSIPICIEILSFLPEMISSKELWQGSKGPVAYSEENIQRMCLLMLRDAPNIIRIIELGLEINSDTLPPFSVLHCAAQWLQCSIHTVSSREEHDLWCELWRSSKILTNVIAFLSTVTQPPYPITTQLDESRYLRDLYPECIDVLSLYCCLIFNFDEHKEFDINLHDFTSQPTNVLLHYAATGEVLPFLSKLLNSAFSSSKALLSSLSLAVDAKTLSEGDIEVNFEAACFPFVSSVQACCQSCTPMLLMLVPLLLDYRRQESMRGDLTTQQCGTCSVTTTYSYWAEFLSTLANTVTIFVHDMFEESSSTGSLEVNLSLTTSAGLCSRRSRNVVLSLARRKVCLQLTEMMQAAVLLPIARVQHHYQLQLQLVQAQQHPPVSRLSASSLGGMTSPPLPSFTTSSPSFSSTANRPAPLLTRSPSTMGLLPISGGSSPRLPNTGRARSNSGFREKVASHPLLLYCMQHMVTASIMASRCTSELDQLNESDYEDMEEVLSNFRTTLRDNLREVSSTNTDFLFWMVETSVLNISALVSAQSASTPPATVQPVQLLVTPSSMISRQWQAVEAQLHACTAVTKNIVDFVRGHFSAQSKSKRGGSRKQKQSSSTSPLPSAISSPAVLSSGQSAFSFASPFGSAAAAATAALISDELGDNAESTGLPTGLMADVTSALQLVLRLLFVVLDDSLLACRPVARMSVLLASDLVPDLQALTKDIIAMDTATHFENTRDSRDRATSMGSMSSNSTTTSLGGGSSPLPSLQSPGSMTQKSFFPASTFDWIGYEKLLAELCTRSLRAVLLSLVVHAEEQGHRVGSAGHALGDGCDGECGWKLSFRTKQDHIGAVGMMKLIPAVMALAQPVNQQKLEEASTLSAANGGGGETARALRNCNPTHSELALCAAYLQTASHTGTAVYPLALHRDGYVDMINAFMQPGNESLLVAESVLPVAVSAVLSSYWHILLTTKLMSSPYAETMTIKSFNIAQDAAAAAFAYLHLDCLQVGRSNVASGQIVSRSGGGGSLRSSSFGSSNHSINHTMGSGSWDELPRRGSESEVENAILSRTPSPSGRLSDPCYPIGNGFGSSLFSNKLPSSRTLSPTSSLSTAMSNSLTPEESKLLARCHLSAVGQIVGPYVAALIYLRTRERAASGTTVAGSMEEEYERLVREVLEGVFASPENLLTPGINRCPVAVPIVNCHSAPAVATPGHSTSDTTATTAVTLSIHVVSMPTDQVEARSLSGCLCLGEKIALTALDAASVNVNGPSGVGLGCIGRPGSFTNASKQMRPSQMLLPLLANILNSINTTWKNKACMVDLLPCFDAKLELVERVLLPVIEMLVNDFKILKQQQHQQRQKQQQHQQQHVPAPLASSSDFDFLMAIGHLLGATSSGLLLSNSLQTAISTEAHAHSLSLQQHHFEATSTQQHGLADGLNLYPSTFSPASSPHTQRRSSPSPIPQHPARLAAVSRLFARFVDLSVSLLEIVASPGMIASATSAATSLLPTTSAPLPAALSAQCSAIAAIGVKTAEGVLKVLASWQTQANVTAVFAHLFKSVSCIAWETVTRESQLSAVMTHQDGARNRPPASYGRQAGYNNAEESHGSVGPTAKQPTTALSVIVNGPVVFTPVVGCAASILVDFWLAGMLASNLAPAPGSTISTTSSSAPGSGLSSTRTSHSHASPQSNGFYGTIGEPSSTASHSAHSVRMNGGASPSPSSSLPNRIPFLHGCGADMFCGVLDALSGFAIAECPSAGKDEMHSPSPLLQRCMLSGSSRQLSTWRAILTAIGLTLGPIVSAQVMHCPMGIATSNSNVNSNSNSLMVMTHLCTEYPQGDPEVVSLLLSSQRVLTVTRALLYGLCGCMDSVLRDDLCRCMQKLFLCMGAQTGAAAISRVIVTHEDRRPFCDSNCSRQLRLSLGSQLHTFALENNWKKFKNALKMLAPKSAYSENL